MQTDSHAAVEPVPPVSFSDSELRMPHYLVEQVNEDFPGEAWKPLVPPASALGLSFTGVKDIMETFYPSFSKRPGFL